MFEYRSRYIGEILSSIEEEIATGRAKLRGTTVDKKFTLHAIIWVFAD